MEDDIVDLAKQCLSIASSATLKDEEIKMWVLSGIEDLKRQGINVDLENSLIQASIVMFVKSNFGMIDLKDKELAQRTYNSLCSNLSLSSDYKVVDDNA